MPCRCVFEIHFVHFQEDICIASTHEQKTSPDVVVNEKMKMKMRRKKGEFVDQLMRKYVKEILFSSRMARLNYDVRKKGPRLVNALKINLTKLRRRRSDSFSFFIVQNARRKSVASADSETVVQQHVDQRRAFLRETSPVERRVGSVQSSFSFESGSNSFVHRSIANLSQVGKHRQSASGHR